MGRLRNINSNLKTSKKINIGPFIYKIKDLWKKDEDNEDSINIDIALDTYNKYEDLFEKYKLIKNIIPICTDIGNYIYKLIDYDYVGKYNDSCEGNIKKNSYTHEDGRFIIYYANLFEPLKNKLSLINYTFKINNYDDDLSDDEYNQWINDKARYMRNKQLYYKYMYAVSDTISSDMTSTESQDTE